MARQRLAAAAALFGWALWGAQSAAGQAPVDGVCDESVVYGCSAGRPNDDAFPDRPDAYVWRCEGLNAGHDSGRCVKYIPVDGACDDTVRNGCSSGTANDAAIPDTSTGYLWRCDGLHGGANSEKCHIRVEDVPIDGVCDDTVRNGCSSGTANDAAFADNSTGYLWRCDGLHGGTNSDKCFIRIEDVPIDGVCDDTVRNGCTAGTANDAAIPDTSTGYLWRCDGLHGGANSEKCHIRVEDVPVDGACDESVRNGCATGTANDGAFADTASDYRWRCDGRSGGSNSGACSIAKPAAQVSCGGSWSPSSSTVCSGRSFAQTRTCAAGCNDGDCATSRGAVGTGSCPDLVPCGSPWSPSASTVCTGTSFTQTRRCAAGCNTGNCSESRSLNGTKPARNCRWGSWSAWSDWSACANNTKTRTRTRSKTTTEQCGGACPGSATETETQACPEPVICDAPWSPWSPAPSTVCVGTTFPQTSTRTCPPGCNTGNCSERRSRDWEGMKPRLNCTWGPYSWTPWSACSATCGGGTQTRTGTRSKTREEQCGGSCAGSSTKTERRTCNSQACPISCGGTWSDYSRVWTGSYRCENRRSCAEFFDRRTRTCNAGCNDGDCDTEQTTAVGYDCSRSAGNGPDYNCSTGGEGSGP